MTMKNKIYLTHSKYCKDTCESIMHSFDGICLFVYNIMVLGVRNKKVGIVRTITNVIVEIKKDMDKNVIEFGISCINMESVRKIVSFEDAWYYFEKNKNDDMIIWESNGYVLSLENDNNLSSFEFQTPQF